MPDIKDGEQVEMQGSGKKPYILKNVSGVYSCNCPSWRNAGGPIDSRSCKHLRKYRGDEAEEARLGRALDVVPDKKEKPIAPPLLLANVWTPDIDPTGYYMSEKLDGVRSYWYRKNFISRLGNIYHAPQWFKDVMPDITLDGELGTGHKQFQK